MEKKTDNKGGKKPFFARYLEGQELEQVTGGKKPPIVTLKYPSDADENTTLKYPSDDDEGSVDI